MSLGQSAALSPQARAGARLIQAARRRPAVPHDRRKQSV